MIFSDCYKNRKVLVTGHTGFKGAWLTEWLLELGAKVAGVSLRQVSEPSLFELQELSKKLAHHEQDICELDALCKIFEREKPEIVFHLAAQALVLESFRDPRKTFDTNVMGTVNVLEACRATPSVKTVLVVTSDKCYENTGKEVHYDETDRLGSNDPYSGSKACAEFVVQAYVKSILGSTPAFLLATARAGNVIGGGDWAKDRILPDCVRAWSKKEPVFLRWPNAVRPWQHVLEPLSGYLLLGSQMFLHKQFHGSAFNFGPNAESEVPVAQLVKQFGNGWEYSKFDISEENVKAEAKFLALNCKKAFRELAWQPLLGFSETVKMSAEWYRNYYEKQGNLTSAQIQRFVDLAQSKNLTWAIK